MVLANRHGPRDSSSSPAWASGAVADVRCALYGHTLTLDQQYFLKTRTGASAVAPDHRRAPLIEQLVGASASIALRNILSLVGGLGYMAVVSPKLAGFIVLMVPVIRAPMFLVGRRVRKPTVTAQDVRRRGRLCRREPGRPGDRAGFRAREGLGRALRRRGGGGLARRLRSAGSAPGPA
ncbi:ABC transporter transmembrane domain-containing protein [Caulobacter segnis]